MNLGCGGGSVAGYQVRTFPPKPLKTNRHQEDALFVQQPTGLPKAK